LKRRNSVESPTKTGGKSGIGYTADELERIVDADQYQYTNLGPKWDIVNGYIGGEVPNKRLSYE
jgi:hypothetical protein